MKTLSAVLALLSMFDLGFSQPLKISDNNRFIQQADGSPFLWIGDTAWELFHRLNREEASEYLSVRVKQGFTVIQAVVLAENDGLRTPNPYGAVPLIDLDPERPNEKYFEHVDYIVNEANRLGLYVAMLPTWGDKLYSLHPAAGPIVFNRNNAETYGAFLGKRYRDKNIIWILGGDRNVDSFEVLEIWRAMARGLKSGDNGRHLMSYHPRGESSSSYFLHNEEWLDFNMYQSGHARRFNHVYTYAETDYLKLPVKPFVEGEPAYEDIPVRFWEYCDWSIPKRVPDEVLNEEGLVRDTSYFKEGFFTDYDVRIHAYWNFLSGACGYTYGNNAVWQMYKSGGPIAIPCLTDWREALDRKGANQLIFLKNLFESRPFSTLVPDQSIIYGVNRRDERYVRAARSNDGKSLVLYLSMGQPVQVVMDKIADPRVTGYWYNPRNGKSDVIGEFGNSGIETFTPPTNGIDNDWVLVLDGKSAGLDEPCVR